MRCTSFDLPEVEPIAKKYIAAGGLENRISTACGNFFKDALPKADVITMGMISLPTMLRRGYDKRLICGTICASGTLGQIIPPSLILILLSDIMQLSVGTLFAAAVVPGLMLAAIYCIYIVMLGFVRPEWVPAVPKDERDATLARLESGELELVTNCMVLTEGWDMPECGCIILARPTKKMGLYRQMLRPADGKT